MVASIRGYTPNYSFKLVNFDTPRWHTLEYANWNQVDALLLQAGIPAMRGDWQYGTTYFEGDRVFDPDDGALYRCLVTHTSAASGTFAEDRALHPTYWTLQTVGVPLWRGVWAPTVSYVLGDLVVVDSYRYYLCTTNHMSGTSFPPDAGNWTLVFDATAAVTITTDKANEAAASATAAAGSATDAATSATEAATSVVLAAEQASKLYGTSTTAISINTGNVTLETQAGKYFNIGKFVMIRANTDPINVWMWGQVVAYGGTSLTVNRLSTFGMGSFNDWIIDVSGVKGSTGDQGPAGAVGPPLLILGTVPNAAALPPTGNKIGDAYITADTQHLWIWDGTQWDDAGAFGGGGGATVVTSDTAPVSPKDGDMWWKSDIGILFVYYDDGTSSQWVQSVPTPSLAGVVSVDAGQTFTEAQKTQGRANIYAAPLDALAYNGMQVNGSMEVSQENGSTTIPVLANTSRKLIDGWTLVPPNAAFNVQQQSSTKPGFNHQLAVYNLVATTFAGDDELTLHQSIEGYRWARMGWGFANGAPVTVGFWVSASVNGTLTVSARNYNVSRSCCVPVAYTSAPNWQYLTATIPACPDGAWNTFTDVGCYVSICMGCGPNRTGQPGTWLPANYVAATGQTNFFANASQVVYVTGFVVLPGIEAPTAAQSSRIMRPADQELLTCKRYFERVPLGAYDAVGSGQAVNTTVAQIFMYYITKRARPTLLHSAFSDFLPIVANGTGGAPVTDMVFGGSLQNGVISCTISGTPLFAIGDAASLIVSGTGANALIAFDARL